MRGQSPRSLNAACTSLRACRDDSFDVLLHQRDSIGRRWVCAEQRRLIRARPFHRWNRSDLQLSTLRVVLGRLPCGHMPDQVCDYKRLLRFVAAALIVPLLT